MDCKFSVKDVKSIPQLVCKITDFWEVKMYRRWRFSAFCLAATFGLVVAACNDDNGGKQGNDMAASDMSSGQDGSADMSPGVDMLPPGTTAQALAVDIQGTFYSTDQDIPTNTLAHQLLVTTTVPSESIPPDPSSNFHVVASPDGGAPMAVEGCMVYRFPNDYGSAPAIDVDVGDVTLTGYGTKRISFDYNAGKTTFADGEISPTSAIPDTVHCRRGADNRYKCVFGENSSSNNGAPAEGHDVVDTYFPTLPQGGWGDLCQSAGGCTAADCPKPGQISINGFLVDVCEQPMLPTGTELFNAGASGPATVSLSIPGGGAFPKFDSPSFGAGTDNIPVPGELSIASISLITQGEDGNPVGNRVFDQNGNGKDDLSDLDGVLAAETQSLEIVWSCDPNDNTPGQGCDNQIPPTSTAGTPRLDLVQLIAQTSNSPREAFNPHETEYGYMVCAWNSDDTLREPKTYTITVTKEQITALLGNQLSGSIKLSLVHVDATPNSQASGVTESRVVGHGIFDFVGLPGVFSINKAPKRR
jgi:hypothetical protein